MTYIYKLRDTSYIRVARIPGKQNLAILDWKWL